jgi:hypothetical protein
VFLRRKLICVNRGLLVMNISMSTFRFHLIDRNSKCPTVLKQKDNQIRQAENTFSPKRFYPESYEYLIVFYEFSITRSSIFGPNSHRISHPSFTCVPSSLLSRRTHRKLSFCVAMNSKTVHQKLFVQTRNENIEIELVPSIFRSFGGVSVRIREARKKGDFQCILFFWTFEIIKMRMQEKLAAFLLEQLIWYITADLR